MNLLQKEPVISPYSSNSFKNQAKHNQKVQLTLMLGNAMKSDYVVKEEEHVHLFKVR